MVRFLYLDTARLGQMCPEAQAADRDFARLAGEEGCSLYFEEFLRGGFATLGTASRRRFAGLAAWGGVSSLKRDLKTLAGLAVDRKVLLASRSAQLVQLAASLLCARCENILVTDMIWPAYREILSAECHHTGRSITTVPLRQAVLRDRISQAQLVDLVAGQCRAQHCDGLLLSAVTFEGIRLPVPEICQRIRASSRLGFVVVDGAQALSHAPLQLEHEYCDFLVAGSHKWLRAYHPMGFGFCCRKETEGTIVRHCENMFQRRKLDDPLLRFSEQLESNGRESFCETVNVGPLFTATAAASRALCAEPPQRAKFALQLANADRLARHASRTGWRVLRPKSALRSGILLLEARSAQTQAAQVDALRAAFRRAGIALTVYADGIIRVSLLRRALTAKQLNRIRRTLCVCA